MKDQVMKKLGKQRMYLYLLQKIQNYRLGSVPLAHRPVVMGFGPAGMLAAFYLAREGYRPIVLEHGQDRYT